jgi:hypothetical protein
VRRARCTQRLLTLERRVEKLKSKALGGATNECLHAYVTFHQVRQAAASCVAVAALQQLVASYPPHLQEISYNRCMNDFADAHSTLWHALQAPPLRFRGTHKLLVDKAPGA